MSMVSGRSIRFKGKYLFSISASKITLFVFLFVMVCFTALPLVYVAVTAFKPIDELYLFPPTFFTKRPSLNNFKSLLSCLSGSEVPFLRYVFNSLFVTVISVTLSVFVSTLGAYGLVKQRPKGSNVIFAVILAALMFPASVTQIPSYLVVKELGVLNSYIALIITKVAVAFNFFLMKQFMEQIPDAYLEAARMDGAGELYIYAKIIMPMMKPACATLIVFSFISSWNDYMGPLIYTSKATLKTLPLAVQMISGGTGAAAITTAGAVAASTFVMTVPVIVVYLLMQNQVLSTMAHSGIK